MLLVTALSIETLKEHVLGLATAVHDSIDRDYTHSLPRCLKGNYVHVYMCGNTEKKKIELIVQKKEKGSKSYLIYNNTEETIPYLYIM